MTDGEEGREYVTLLQPPGEATLAALLDVPGGVRLSLERGEDAAGRSRVVVAIAHPDPEVVARTRQNLLRACLARGVPAFVV